MTLHSLRLDVVALLMVVALPIAGCGKAPGEVQLPDDPQNESEGAELPSEVSAPLQVEPNVPALAPTSPVKAQVLAKYQYLDPQHVVPTNLLETAVLYFDSQLSSIANQNYLSVIDFSKRSTLARFFIIDMKTGEVWAIHTAHGAGSDRDGDGYADQFSNLSGSNMSSLGVYKTAETYYGKNGLSLRMDGLSSTNSNARARAVVIHGASYVQEKSVIQGRSWGCPGVAQANRDEVVKRLKGGSLVYAGLSGQR